MPLSYRAIALAVFVVAVPAQRGRAQETETPIAFDSGGTVRSITPALAERFSLKPPAWPVLGDFVEARLFALANGGRILSVLRASGAIDRYALSEDHGTALRFAINEALSHSGRVVTEERADVISEPARGAFVRNQMALTWGLYGPLLASLTNDAKAGTAVYMLATGASYFITTGISRRTTVTRAQNHLAFDGALRGWGASAGLLYAIAGEGVGQNTYSAVGLAGAVAGSVAGFRFGRRLTDSEAEAATTISTFGALGAFGISGAAGRLNDVNDGRADVASIVVAGLAGYALGPRYPRRAGYTVTRGDVQILEWGAILGVMAAVTPFVDSRANEQLGFGIATTGMVAGALITDRAWVRGYDHSTSDATQVGLGALAGGLMGSGVAILTEPSARGTMGLITAGAILGSLAGHNFARPPKASEKRVGMGARSGALNGATVTFDPATLVLSAARVPGRHALVTVRF